MNKQLKLTLFLFLLSLSAFAQNKVLVFEIRDEIDPRMNRHVELAFEKATEVGATHVVIDMDTYGGVLTDADDIRQRILDFDKPVYVFINKNAASAGALISIACDKIYMAKGASIGAATVVNGNDGARAPDKYQSYMRSIMRATAETKGRNPKVAEAMVDENIYVEGISEIGQVITFTPTEAQRHGFCDGIAVSVDEVLEMSQVSDAEIVRYEPSSLEGVIAFFLNPAVSSVLILIILGGIYYELQSPGIGFPIVAAIFAGVLYFVPYYLTDLAAIWELIALVIGIGLIIAEVFVIPGFGIAGIAGILLTISSLILMMLDNDNLNFEYVDPDSVVRAVAVGATAFIGTIVLIVFGLMNLTNTKFYKKVALQDTLSTEDGYTSRFNLENLMGMEGTAHTVLRPSGKVLIDDEIYDATTRGSFVEKGSKVVVVSQEGTSVKVKMI
ncbi:MAG: membrane-bound serine protease (ClpP class) [Arenicella sp.]|jgi:membrane-bound serine protease (ClpP class)